MVTRIHNKHTSNNGEAIRIDYIPFNNSYLVYVNGEFQESLDNYDISDRERLKLWERL